MNYFIIRNFSFIFFVLVLSNVHPEQLSQSTWSKEKTAKKVYLDIGKTIKDSRKLPTFNFKESDEIGDINAWYDPDNNTINLTEGMYDLCVGFKADSLNVLAGVISHELAHFYKDHGWGYSFGLKNEKLSIAGKIYKQESTAEGKAKMETEADYFGGIFCYLSGYNFLGLSEDFFDALYQALDLPDSTFGYPTRKERIAISISTHKMLESLVPVFDAANILTALGKYDDAASCYDHIIAKFPSREMYNNEGVMLALEALTNYNSDELDFIYPFTLETQTRLHNAGKRGMAAPPAEKRIQLLNDALELFNEAKHIDKNYALPYINLALANDLLGEPEMALAMAMKAVKLSNETESAGAHIALGIAYAHNDDLEMALEEFKKAKELNSQIAAICEKVVNEDDAHGYSMMPKESAAEIESVKDESINELDPSLLEVVLDDAVMIEIERQNENRPKIKVYASYTADYHALYIKTYSYPKSVVGIVATPDNYQGRSARGIAIGEERKKVEEFYGSPTSVIPGTGFNFMIYEKSNIIFKLSSVGTVLGWYIFQK